MSFKNNRVLFFGLLIVMLVISLVFKVVYFLVLQPQRLVTMNSMRAKAFQSWLEELNMIAYHLERAETNFDVRKAEYIAYLAWRSDDIFRVETADHEMHLA